MNSMMEKEYLKYMIKLKHILILLKNIIKYFQLFLMKKLVTFMDGIIEI